MAKVIYIKAETELDGVQYLGDIVEVLEDDRWLSPSMLEAFNVLTISGSKADVQARLNQIIPRVKKAYLLADGDYHWDRGDEDPVETIRVFQVEGSNRWYKQEEKFKFPMNLAELTPEEKQLLETVNINHPSVDSFIRKLVKDITILSGNDVEVKELRNTEP